MKFSLRVFYQDKIRYEFWNIHCYAIEIERHRNRYWKLLSLEFNFSDLYIRFSKVEEQNSKTATLSVRN